MAAHNVNDPPSLIKVSCIQLLYAAIYTAIYSMLTSRTLLYIHITLKRLLEAC